MTGRQVLALSFGELTLPIDCLDPETELRLRAQLRRGKGRRRMVTVVPVPGDTQDVEGHTFAGTLRSVLVHVRMNETGESRPVRVQFPTSSDADHFRRNLLAAGVLAGSLALGSVGVASLANQGAGSAGTANAGSQVVQSVTRPNMDLVLPGNRYSGKSAVKATLELENPAALSNQDVTLPGSRYSGKAAIKATLDLEPAAPSDEQVVLPGSRYSGKASVEETLK